MSDDIIDAEIETSERPFPPGAMQSTGPGRLLMMDGIDYSPDGIANVISNLITGRDVLLEAGAVDQAAFFTHTIALLAYLKEARQKGLC